MKSVRSTPVTGSLNVMLTLPTALFRGSGVISIMSAVGAVVSVSQLSEALTLNRLPTASMIPELAATSVRTYGPSLAGDAGQVQRVAGARAAEASRR